MPRHAGRRHRGGLVVLGVAVIALVGATGARPGLAEAVRSGGPRALTILPPGEGNTITLDGFLRNQASGDCRDLGPYTCQQLDMYKNWQFKDAALSADASHVVGAVSSESPIPGLRIVRDRWGVPHVFASGSDEQSIEENIGFGVGWAQAEERLFQMEVLRRAATGTLSDLVGPGSGNAYARMDAVMRRDAETDAERRREIATILSAGQRRSLQRYADGINAYAGYLAQHPDQMPAGFPLTSDLPIPTWSVSDVVAIQILEAKQVAESSGNELGYAALARRLKAHYGTAAAVGMLDDVQLTEDPLTPTSVPHTQAAVATTDGQSYDFISYTAADTAARIDEVPASVEQAAQVVQNGNDAVHTAGLTLGLPHPGSNAWAIAPSRSSTGGALLWGAPQVSYYVPQVLDELEISGGATHARGMGVPGGGPAVVIGYTPHHAWSLTSSQDDQVDTYVDRIRATNGGATYQYFWRGAWHPVQQRTEVIRTRTNGPGPLPAPPVVYTTRTMTVYRTLHGPPGQEIPCTVSYLDTAAGVSYCKARAFWGAELMTGLAIVDMGMATNLAQADAAARHSVVGFNFIYADAEGHIGYWHTGRTPVRVRGHDPRLPAPGDGSFDWRDYLNPQRWPSVIDPAQGFVVSWNNKPQLSWPDSGDGTLWGPQQRMGQPRALLAASGPLDQTGLWQIARRTGELDLHDTLGFRPFLTGLAGRADLTTVERAALAQVMAWDGTAFYPDGADRDNAGNETGKIRYPGYAVFAEWFRALERRVGRGVFQPVTGNVDAGAGVRAFTQTPGTTSPEFEFFDDYDGFLYDVLAGRTRSGTDYLGAVGALGVSKAALDDAVAALSRAQGSDPARWRATMPQITFAPTDVSSIPSIPWENRGTWGQAVDFGAGAAGAPAATPAAPAGRGPSTLPATGTSRSGLVELVAVLALMGLLVARVRSRA